MNDLPRNDAHDQTGSAGKVLLGRAVLALLGGGVLWLIWIGYTQPGMLMQMVNLRYCG